MAELLGKKLSKIYWDESSKQYLNFSKEELAEVLEFSELSHKELEQINKRLN